MDLPCKLRGLSLFTGIGGIDLALDPWVQPCAYCENCPDATALLVSHMARGNLPTAGIWDDVRTLKGTMFGGIDIISGGFPCQDISCANPNGKGLEGQRSGLYWHIHRLAGELKPAFVFLENVPAITTRGGLVVVKSITELGYDCRWTILSARTVGSKTRQNNRWFILAKAKSIGRLFIASESGGSEESNAEKSNNQEATRHNDAMFSSGWKTRADAVYRNAYGISKGVDRLRLLGNSCNPWQARRAFEMLMGIVS